MPLWETIFLGDVAAENYGKYQEMLSEEVRDWVQKLEAARNSADNVAPHGGLALVVNSSDIHSALTMYNIHSSLKRPQATKMLKYREKVSIAKCSPHWASVISEYCPGIPLVNSD